MEVELIQLAAQSDNMRIRMQTVASATGEPSARRQSARRANCLFFLVIRLRLGTASVNVSAKVSASRRLSGAPDSFAINFLSFREALAFLRISE